MRVTYTLRSAGGRNPQVCRPRRSFAVRTLARSAAPEAAQAAILIRLRRLALGLAGDTKSVGAGVFELRVHIGPGYRVYFAWEGPDQALLLGGGTKATQAIDIATARQRLIAHRGKVKH